MVAALNLMVPSSVSSSGGTASVSASGKVTWSGAASVSVNDCFTSSYKDYYIILSGTHSTGDTNTYMRLRASGSDNTSSVYTYQNFQADNTSVSAARFTSGQGFLLGNVTTTLRGNQMNIFAPYQIERTLHQHYGMAADRLYDDTNYMNAVASYDGFTILTSSGTFSGSLTVYGYAE